VTPVRDVPSQDAFWVEQVVTIYLGPSIAGRLDPRSVVLSWAEPEQDGPVYIARQELQDSYDRSKKNDPPNLNTLRVPFATYLSRVILHESLHRFGMTHENASNDPHNPGVQGLMQVGSDPDTLLYGTAAAVALTTDQIGWLQEVKDPGKEFTVPKLKGG